MSSQTCWKQQCQEMKVLGSLTSAEIEEALPVSSTPTAQGSCASLWKMHSSQLFCSKITQQTASSQVTLTRGFQWKKFWWLQVHRSEHSFLSLQFSFLLWLPSYLHWATDNLSRKMDMPAHCNYVAQLVNGSPVLYLREMQRDVWGQPILVSLFH